MNYIQRIRSRASKVPKRIILSEGTDDRVILAAIEAIKEGFGEMTLLGPKDIINQKLLNFTSALEKTEQNEISSKTLQNNKKMGIFKKSWIFQNKLIFFQF